jgi:hypothetical protein
VLTGQSMAQIPGPVRCRLALVGRRAGTGQNAGLLARTGSRSAQ